MSISIINGLAEVAGDYDLYICDLWGVVHDGVAVYDGAGDCLRQLRRRGAKVVLLSNAPRLSASVAAHLTEIGVPDKLYDRLLTSGEATAGAIAATAKGSGARARPAYYHLGPARCQPTVDACGGREVPLAQAEMIICTGLLDDETEQPEDYRGILQTGVARGLPLICANPDLEVMRGARVIPCAGAVAALYEEMGGTVRRFGKPHRPIFDRLFAEMPDIPRTRAVMIGDTLATDIRGARLAGIDSIWVAGGIQAEALGFGPDERLDPERIDQLAEQAGERPTALIPWLRW